MATRAMTFGSINEQNVYQALTKLKIDFFYQYSLDGGRSVRGGQVIDFVLWLPPKPIALYIQGRYWHKGRKALEDELKQAAAEKHGFYVQLLWEEETMTLDDATAALKAKVV